MIKARKIELLAPAKNLECGIEAVNHGADAIYIGAPRFSARAAVGNTIDDIAELVKYAHLFNVKVYVALNTILKDEELPEAELLIWKLYKVGIDALIIQDMGITMLNLPPIPLHASTQIDNRSPEKAKFLEDAGFSQIVLARELGLDEIRNISGKVSTPLEFFIHGALCVSYSGQCYLSEALSGRSANRGTCAQFCRLPYTLADSDGKVIKDKKHLLSLKDLNLSDRLEDLLDAGVSSLKIEGRLKDLPYVKNIVAFYRQKLDSIINRRPEYQRSSSGTCSYTFTPDAEKSFNRGFTRYFIDGRADDIWSVDSPKSIGEPIGRVKSVFDRFFVLSGTKKLNNGDGLCYLDDNKELRGVRVNRIDGEKIFPAEQHLKLKQGTFLYRNFDHEFDKVLSRKSAERKINVEISLREVEFGFVLEAMDEDFNSVSLVFDQKKEIAQKDQSENLKSNLSRTGNTVFNVSKVDINISQNWFIPASQVADWRRAITERLMQVRNLAYRNKEPKFEQTYHVFPEKEITYLGNVMNNKSRLFYEQHQSVVVEPAFERKHRDLVPLMFSRHCIKYSLGICPRVHKDNTKLKEPLFLLYNDTRLQLVFDCKECEMKVIKNA
ncbi:U32 family peptidase [Dysgonomonas sp. 216]|uniref:peptidase U32 family protein n=1 Tax=Dysgonomonas sp. 216 TaxID=2302934 RepID=UPI0013D18C48|nr:U32 family peptidase [Dysgonomonas sp. 216]NDW18540.1 U32 family peptidase [Dysgonomonas sp. 216]